jgi:hypothetical protein
MIGVRMKTRWPAIKVKAARPFGFNKPWRAVDLEWRELKSRKSHTFSLVTGAAVPDSQLRYFHAKQKEVRETVVCQAALGQKYSKFYVYKNGERIGRGFFARGVDVDDIPHLFAKLRAVAGCEAFVAWSDYCEPKSSNVTPYYGLLDCYAYDARPIPAVGEDAITLSMAHMESDESGDLISNPQREYLSIGPDETMPQHFSGMWHEKRAMYAKALAACSPEAFRIYSVWNKSKTPTLIWAMRDNRYWTVGEVSEGENGGGYYTEAHGSFDKPPTPESLAFVACRLAAHGRWIHLVPRQEDNVRPEILGLMHAPTANFGFETTDVAIPIKPISIG